MLATRCATDPEAAWAPVRREKTPAESINDIAADPARIDETFANVRIDSDDAVAAFDFLFLREGSVINAGREYWLMARVEHGWCIAGAVWPVN